MKKLDVPLVMNEYGQIGMVINHTKDRNYLEVIVIKSDKLSGHTVNWRIEDIKPWNGNVIISNHQNRIL
jgi:hypothetical protein